MVGKSKRKSELSSDELLREAGLRNTSSRRAVLDLILREKRPLSHQEIADSLAEIEIDKVTLYRTLTTLQEVDLIHRIQGVDGAWRFGGNNYESGVCGGNHIHFLCLECNQMSCLSKQPLPWIQAPHGAEVFGKQLVVYGRCSHCKKKSKRA